MGGLPERTGGQSGRIEFTSEHVAGEHLMGRIALDLVDRRALAVKPSRPSSETL
jgi:hypothetical protein